MKKLFACIKKDIALLCGGGVMSVLCLILPVALMFLLMFYMGGAARASNYLEPFAIAVRDEDETMMSDLLVTQLRNIPAFGEVRKVTDETDEELCEAGCAAVITVPKDFFYDLYDMQDTDVRLKLNASMPREASIVKAVVTSVSSIIVENQKIYYGAARVRYGELDSARMEEVYYEYSETAVMSALNRLDYFEVSELYADEEQNTVLFFASGICSMLMMFMPLCILRNLYEEKELGMISRLKAAGGGVWQTVLAKLIAAFLMTAIPCAAVLIITKAPCPQLLIPSLLILFAASFCFYLFLSLVCRSAERAQLIGNMVMLLMLILGGALLPYRLLPESIQKLSVLALPYYTLRSFYAASLGSGFGDMIKLLLPVLLSIPVFAGASLALYKLPSWSLRRAGK